MKVLIPRETADGETRVAAVPETVKRLVKAGLEVQVEAGAGAKSSFLDSEFTKAGAEMVTDVDAAYSSADLVLKLHPPSTDELPKLGAGTTLISYVYPLSDHDLVKRLAEHKITSLSMDMIPRISRAQKMDSLSSQSNIAGYKAVLLAATQLGKLFPLLMTAAGTIKPAKVVILGAGVAGLQAIATAKRLGAVVEVSDIRPAVKEQVESLGARFIEVPTDEGAEDAGGYAKEASADFKRRQEEELRKRLAEADVVICTALIPGRPAPKLLSPDMVELMPEGSVIVDLAAEQGGNCALTKPGETVVEHGVSIVGMSNVPGSVPVHASEMYAKNVLAFVTHFMKDGKFELDREDEITQGSLITTDGEIVHPATRDAMGMGGGEG